MSSAICSICNSPRSDSMGPCVVCGAAPTAPAHNLPAGTHLQNGKYTLGRVLGEGGFGITYQGAHRHLKRTVAIKELFPERAVRHGITVSVPDSQQNEFHFEVQDRCRTIALSHGARTVASLGDKPAIRLWDVDSATVHRTLEGHSGVESMAFSVDGRILAGVGGDLKSIHLWDVATGELRYILKGHRSEFYGMAFSPDSRILAIGESDGTLRLWDVFIGKRRHILAGHRDGAYGVVFSPDGKRIACGGRDGAVYLWDR